MKIYYDLDEQIKEICSFDYSYFLNKLNVIGVGLGYKIKNGFYICQKCITVFVRKKVLKNQLCIKDLIPVLYKGIPVDVIESSIPKICSLRGKVRPVLGGYSIGVNGFESGSMGCLVGDSHEDYILTCNHVIAQNLDQNVGKPVIQPSPEYGGKNPRDMVGKVYGFDEILYDGENNYTDSALVETHRDLVSQDIAFIGSIIGSRTPRIGETVQKVGSTTELTKGTVKNVAVEILVDFLGRQVLFNNQIMTTKMSEKGDSGSVLLDKKRYALGLLMAQTDSMSIFNNIDTVTNRLNVHIIRH